MKELRDVECARCRRAGHRCQAQIWIDSIPLCLRCADDGPCIFVTAARFEEPPPIDLFAIPAPSREDLRAVRSMPRLRSVHATIGIESAEQTVGPNKRAAILADIFSLTVAQIAEKYHLSKNTVQNIKSKHRRKIRERAFVNFQAWVAEQ